jgi:threonine dehydratase
MEIGNSPCIRLPLWEDYFGFESVWVKDESKNPSGTFKDRRSQAIIQHAKQNDIKKIVLISMGNAANSLAKLSVGTDMKICAVVDRNLTPGIREKLHTVCHRVCEVDLHTKVLTSDEIINMVRDSAEERILDATNEFHAAYAEIIRELKQQLPIIPDAIFMPHGAGEAMTGVLQGVEEVGWRLRTSVIGIRNSGIERLRTEFFHKAYAGCMQIGKFPLRLVLETSTQLTREQIQAVVPTEVQTEDAAALVFGYVVANAHKLPQLKKPKNIVLINSGCGEITKDNK